MVSEIAPLSRRLARPTFRRSVSDEG